MKIAFLVLIGLAFSAGCCYTESGVKCRFRTITADIELELIAKKQQELPYMITPVPFVPEVKPTW